MITYAMLHSKYGFDWRWFLAGCVLLSLLLLTSAAGLSANQKQQLPKSGNAAKPPTSPMQQRIIIKDNSKLKAPKILRDDLQGLT